MALSSLIQGDVIEMIKKNKVTNLPKPPRSLAEALRDLPKCSDDFFAEGRKDTPPQERDFFD
jgi:hypothetical protein